MSLRGQWNRGIGHITGGFFTFLRGGVSIGQAFVGSFFLQPGGSANVDGATAFNGSENLAPSGSVTVT